MTGNLNNWDRMIRATLGVVALQLAFFWLAGSLQLAAVVLGAVMLVTAVVRFCPLYRLMGWNTLLRDSQSRRQGKPWVAGLLGAALLVAVAAGGSYASNFFSRKLFIEDFNAMNGFYKQTLFWTGKDDREKATANYASLVPAFEAFAKKYTAYQPYALKRDGALAGDLASVGEMFGGVSTMVQTGDLHEAHLALEKARPVFQNIFKRNGFSMLAVALVDFHDDMELMLDAANDKNTDKLMALYPQVSDKLKAVESETNDADIEAIRRNLDGLLALAKSGQADKLSARADALKSSFVKVYLQRG